jgi:hypothetical protein
VPRTLLDYLNFARQPQPCYQRLRCASPLALAVLFSLFDEWMMKETENVAKS